MSGRKVVDMSVEPGKIGWLLYVPITTGHLEVTVPYADDDLNRFLQTVFNTPVRRFGEMPE